MTDHKGVALARIVALNYWHGSQGKTDTTMISSSILAQVDATLYLAKQQRIANLIAMLPLVEKEMRDKTMKTISEGLGL